MNADTIVKAAFKCKMEGIKDDIREGRLTFHNSPEVWTEKQLRLTAFNVTLIQLALEGKWN